MSQELGANLEQYRAGFEAGYTEWMRQSGATDEYVFLTLLRSANGEYCTVAVEARWQGWTAAKREASTEPSRPPGAQPCHLCEGKGFINQCVICGSSEPRTGSCGSDDPRALCNFVVAGALTDDAKDAAMWRALVADTEAQPCKHPCLRDDLADWVAARTGAGHD